ncbi:MAG: helix-turn-helix domain-containing protein, partial [Treponema sp.]|nr:helix-turn-helix domain-containing protein [Treponema sp.]
MLGRTGKQFLLYYVLFFLCLVVLFIPVYHINLSMVSRTYLDAAGAFLETGLSNFEEDIGHLETLAQSAYNNPKFRRLSYIGEDLTIADYYYTSSLVEDFKRYFAAAGMVADCGIVWTSGIVLSSKRIYFPGENFYPGYFMQEGVSSWEDWIKQEPAGYSVSGFVAQARFVTLERTYEGVALRISFSGGLPRKQPAFFFATLEKSYILSRLATNEVLRDGRIRLREPGGSILIDSLGQEKETGGRDGMVLVEMAGRKRGFRVELDIPNAVFSRRLLPFKRLAVAFAFVYILSGVLLSIFFAQRNAKPIREIVKDVLNFGSRQVLDRNPEDFKSDYQYIQHFLSKAGNDYDSFKARLFRQEELQRENLFERLLHGLVYSDAVYQTVREYFPDFPSPFRIAAIALPNMEDAILAAYTMRQAMIQDIIKPHIPPSGYAHFSGNTLVLLLPDEDAEKLQEGLRRLNADLRAKLNADCRVALGGKAADIRNIHQEFYLVRHLLRLPRDLTENDVLRNENISPLSFPIELLDASRLYELMLHGEESKSVDFINNMFYEMCRLGYADENDIQQLFFLYRRILLQIVKDLELDIGKEEIIPAYNSREELSFLFAKVAESIRKICGIINSRREGRETEFERSVIGYIDENITNTSLYTRMVTGCFHISENRLQNIVRRWTGKSFLEYVEYKRMGLARETLLKTSKPISQITGECGYSSENSFYKAFRRFYGMPPSELRPK